MNKKIQSISKILLFPFIFSMFNSACSIAMEDGKKVFDFMYANKVTDKEKINFNKFVSSRIENYLKNHSNPKLQRYQNNYVNEILASEEFKKNIVKISKNIYNMLLLYPFEMNYNYKQAIVLTTNELINMYAHFIQLYSKLALDQYFLLPNHEDFGRPIEFVYNFHKNSILKDLVKYLYNCNKEGNSKKLELSKGFEENIGKFSEYCEQINKNISEIVSIINEKCVSYNKTNSTVFYCEKVSPERSKRVGSGAHDIVILSTFC